MHCSCLEHGVAKNYKFKPKAQSKLRISLFHLIHTDHRKCSKKKEVKVEKWLNNQERKSIMLLFLTIEKGSVRCLPLISTSSPLSSCQQCSDSHLAQVHLLEILLSPAILHIHPAQNSCTTTLVRQSSSYIHPPLPPQPWTSSMPLSPFLHNTKPICLP